MAEVFTLAAKGKLPIDSLHHLCVHEHASFSSLVSVLFEKGNCDNDICHPTLIILAEPTSKLSQLDCLSVSEQTLFLKYYFSHVNPLVVDESLLLPLRVESLNRSINSVNSLVHQRISRVQLWTGTGSPAVNDCYLPEDEELNKEVIDALGTMSFVLNHVSNKSAETDECIRALTKVLVANLEFLPLLSKHNKSHLACLCDLVGRWSFPAHELANDDLAYCAFLMLEFALRHAVLAGLPLGVHVPSANELLAFVFIVRDTYQHGNPFHNFRHAVDVLQACFHFLVRLRCLPRFKQINNDPKYDSLSFLDSEPEHPDTLLTLDDDGCDARPLLNPLEVFGLLLAAIGHDVGHPGVTNAFLINHLSSTSQVFSERSVLELYHATVFTNKVLRIFFPDFLNLSTDRNTGLVLRNLITESILATDMAEHFEYIHKLRDLTLETLEPNEDRVKLISSLLIKCADISNVTRPLRVSSQWALVLTREFEEVETLERKLSKKEEVQMDVKYPKVPLTLDGVLEISPGIHKGQIFFIQTFAEGLFNSILELFPELKYTSDIVEENKRFWLKRAETLAE